MTNRSTLTTWSASCIITGYGIGGGVLAIPYVAQHFGLIEAVIVIVLAYCASWLLHMMIAESALSCEENIQLGGIIAHHMFRSKHAGAMTAAFYAIIVLVLETNLTAYVVGSSDTVRALISVSPLVAKILFYIFAAIIALFGLKAVGISESYAVLAIYVIIGSLAIASCFVPHNELNLLSIGKFSDYLSLFSMAMLSFVAFFSIPQVVEGLDRNPARIRRAITIGLGNNLIISLVILLCTLATSVEITEVALTCWSLSLGNWARITGNAFTLIAILSTYWSLSLALSSSIEDALHISHRPAWLIATLPSLLLSLLGIGDFIDYLEIGAGAIAIIVAILVIPTYNHVRALTKTASASSEAATPPSPDANAVPSLLGVLGAVPLRIFVLISYILMALGSII